MKNFFSIIVGFIKNFICFEFNVNIDRNENPNNENYLSERIQNSKKSVEDEIYNFISTLSLNNPFTIISSNIKDTIQIFKREDRIKIEILRITIIVVENQSYYCLVVYDISHYNISSCREDIMKEVRVIINAFISAYL